MTTLFNGISAIGSDIFGAPVAYTPAGGETRTVVSILRRLPITVVGTDGVDELVTAPTWRVCRDLVPEIARGDLVADAIGLLRVINIWPQGSPATDASLVCELEDMPDV